MPSTMSSSVAMLLASSTVMTPSLPTFCMASAIIWPTSRSPLAEMVPTCAISALVETFFERFLTSSTTASTARSTPRLRSIGFMPAATARAPSRMMACASTVAVVVPSPARSLVLEATSLTIWAPMFSNLSWSSMSLATVTPSLVMRGAPNDLSSTTLRPLGPSVTPTALARISTPRSMRARASEPNFTSLAAMSMDPSLGGFACGDGIALDDAHDVRFLHDDELFPVDFDFGPRPFAEQHAVADLDVQRVNLAVLRTGARPDRDDLALGRLFLCRVGNEDPAGGLLILLDAADQDAIL